MFKKYTFEFNRNDGSKSKSSLDFYVHSKGTRSGFMHRACVIGPVPRLDDKENDWGRRKRNDDTLFKKRMLRVTYLNRTWEGWSGQTCLSRLWEQLDKLKFTDMASVCAENPFGRYEEPEHESLPEPDELFDQFKRRI
jgi:hypothetical protein